MADTAGYFALFDSFQCFILLDFQKLSFAVSIAVPSKEKILNSAWRCFVQTFGDFTAWVDDNCIVVFFTFQLLLIIGISELWGSFYFPCF